MPDKLKDKVKSSVCFWLILFSTLFLSSCAWWEKQKIINTASMGPEECNVGNAPFVVSQVMKSPNNEAVTITHGADGLAKNFTLNLKTCVRDLIRQDNPVQNAPFVVEYYSSVENRKKGIKETAETISDTQGCIQWQEKYKYKYTVKPLWIGLERTIKKESGAYAGAETIPMAVNPWLSPQDKADGLPPVLDIRCEYSRKHHIFDESKNYDPKGLEYLTKMEKRERPFLWAPTVSLQIREVSPKSALQRATEGEEENTIRQQHYKSLRPDERRVEEENTIRQLLRKYQMPCKGREQVGSCYERQTEMVLYVPLQLRSLDMSGLTHRELHGGAYDIETQLIISPEEDRKNYRLHEKICWQEGIELNQTHKSLSFICRFDLSYFNQNALYKLALRIRSSSPDLPFKSFEGVYTINLNFQNERKDFNIDTVYDENYKNVLNTEEELNIIDSMNIRSIQEGFPGVAYGNSFPTQDDKKGVHLQKGAIQGVNFYPLHLDGYGEYKLSHIKSGGSKCSEKENVVQRTAVFVGKICLTDILESQKLNNTLFRVFLERPKENSIDEIYFTRDENNKRQFFRTDGRSCISIPIELKHNLYNRQKYFQVDVHVLSEELNLYGKVRLALSPWQRAFQAFQDAQNLDDSTIRFETTGIPKPQLIINQFRSINLFPSYGLDKLLNVHLFHRIYLLFQPFIRRPDNLSLGLSDRARELLRDGHYLVRVLVLRNPQETGNNSTWSRVGTKENQDKDRENNVTENRISLEGAKYITHTDSVVVAKANFINFYMPLYLSTKQFYYIASRNFIVIEIHPANPKSFQYKGENCDLDMENTVWEPFFGHELENSPYVGAINIQNWMNWNLLQPVKNVNTDQIIEQSEIGRKYKHFNFSPESQKTSSVRKNQPVPQMGCVNGIREEKTLEDIEKKLSGYDEGEIIKTADPSEGEIKECASTAVDPSLSPGLEIYRQEEESRFLPDILKNFAQQNSLRLIHTAEEEGEQFVQDFHNAFEKYLSDNHIDTDEGNFLEDIEFLNQFPEGDSQLLKMRLINICKTGSLFRSNNRECEEAILGAYLQSQREMSERKDPLAVLFNLINQSDLISPEDKLGFEQSLQLCEGDRRNSRECHNGVKLYILQALDSSLIQNFPQRHLILEKLLSLFSLNEKKDLVQRVSSCSSWGGVFPERYEKCYYGHLQNIYNEKGSLGEEMGSAGQDLLFNYFKAIEESKSAGNFLTNLISSNRDKNHEILKHVGSKPDRESLINLIYKGIRSNNKDNPKVLSFAKPLCFFWFDSYIKNYLQKEQMISAYTNYIQKFDYNQMLGNDFIPDQEKQSYLPQFIRQIISEDEGEATSACYMQYAECLIVDHCQERESTQSKDKFCPDIRYVKDGSCTKLLKEECQNDPSHSLCDNECLRRPGSERCGDKNLCHVEVQHFCHTNKDQKLCEKYENRCFSEYLPCLRQASGSHLFSADNVISYNGSFPIHAQKKSFPPLETCLENPYEFFKFENKLIVHELSKRNPRYEGGYLENFFVSANHSIGSYMNWTAQRGRSFSVSSKVSGGADKSTGDIGNIASKVFSFVKLGVSIDFSGSQSVSSNESNSSRRAVDSRAGEGLYLTIGNAKITVGVTKFQKCMVIKPRPNAFTAKLSKGEPELYENVWSPEVKNKNFKKIMLSRPGLILCGPIEDTGGEDPETITESYYYVSHQVDAQNSQFLNLFDLANRPMLMVLRGRKEFVKLYSLLKMSVEGDNSFKGDRGGLNRSPQNMFIEYPFPIEEAVGLGLNIREFNETGFHPGVYDYPDDSGESLDAWFANRDNDFWLLDMSTKHNIFDVPTVQNSTVPFQE